MHQPQLLSSEQVGRLIPDTRSRLLIGGIWGSVEAGQTWLANDGKRLILYASDLQVIYILLNPHNPNNGRVLSQSSKGFIGEVTTYPLIKAAQGASAIARFAEYEIQFLTGIASCISGGVFLAVVGSDLMKFFIENREKFAKWRRAIEAVLQVRDVLITYAPTLYDKLINKLLIELWRSSINLPRAMANDPRIAGRGLGVLVGKIGKNALASRLSVLSVIWTILWTLVKKSLSGIPGAVGITASDKKKAALDIINELKKIGIIPTPSEAEKIINEMLAHPEKVKEALQKLNETFQALKLEGPLQSSE